ncbi:hypothetical protein [Seonamhaeicola marinus]|uniref:Beta-carotene 15,15'-monooxygenase n=1 Tax=Seonamhaeicola marinus TaxID=1912246 RepID=A0A5D0IK52_9FLAO|nr:hypothetical protein [Seonamhaeicola marinus]TYA84263.1 hypothetical protein FUA24_06340 [Seonamhaeicola marinus]
MDGLDLLKKDWNTQKTQSKLSAKDILPMLHKKSSSIVKTLFYISVGELIFWTLVNFLPYFFSEAYKERIDTIGSNMVIIGLSFLSYIVIFAFIFLLYRSYKSISVTDNLKTLMKSIINTRKIIKYYVLYNLVMVGVSSLIGIFYSINNDPNVSLAVQDKGWFVFILFSLVVVGVIIILIWLFYKLIYGLLIKRLNKNYRELKKLEA